MSTTLSAIDQKTKAAETRSNMVAPKLRFREFEGGWQLKSLGELLEFKNGINASKEQYGHGIKFINVLDILNNDFITYDSILGSVNVDEKVAAKYPVNYGDILFQRSSETREEVGTACVYLDPNKTAVFGGFVIRGRKIGIYDPIFLNKLLKTDTSRNEITSKSGGSTRYNVGQETLSSVALNFPTLPEQQKIASFLSAVDEKIQQLTRKKELLEQYKKGVMQNLFSGKLRFKPAQSEVEGDENGKDFPDWEEKKFKNFVKDYRLGGNYQNTTELTDYPLIKMGNLDRGKIKLDKIEYIPTNQVIDPKDEIKYGDLFFNTRNTLDLVGKVAIWRNELPVAYYNSNLMYLKFDNNFFMNYSFNSYEGVKALKRFATGTTSVAAIYTKDLLKLELSIPCLEEQQKIASYLSSIDTKIESVANQITQTQTYKKGLLQQLFV